MAALFINVNDAGLFRWSAGQTASLVSCSLTDELAGKNQSILTNVSISYNETVQFFQSFDDLIHYFYFGKGLGTIRFELMCFQYCEGGQPPGLGKMISKIGENRGKLVSLNMGPVRVAGILMDFTVSLSPDPTPIWTITATLGMTQHNLKKPNIQGSC